MVAADGAVRARHASGSSSSLQRGLDVGDVPDRVPKSFRPGSPRCSCATTRATTRPTWSASVTSSATDLPLTVIPHPDNLGYGGNQKTGYRLAIENGLDIVVLLHGDGQYAPESLPRSSRR